MNHKQIAEILSSSKILQEVEVKGWVRSFRSNRFIALNDGSTIHRRHEFLQHNRCQPPIL